MILSKPKIIAHFHTYHRWWCSAREEWPKNEHPLWSWEPELRRLNGWEEHSLRNVPEGTLLDPMQKEFFCGSPGSIHDLQRLSVTHYVIWHGTWQSVSPEAQHCFVFIVSLIIRYAFIHLDMCSFIFPSLHLASLEAILRNSSRILAPGLPAITTQVWSSWNAFPHHLLTFKCGPWELLTFSLKATELDTSLFTENPQGSTMSLQIRSGFPGPFYISQMARLGFPHFQHLHLGCCVDN